MGDDAQIEGPLLAKKEMRLHRQVKSVSSQLGIVELERKLEVLLHKNEKCHQEASKLAQEKISIQSSRLQLAQQVAEQTQSIQQLRSSQQPSVLDTAAKPLAHLVAVKSEWQSADTVAAPAIVYSRSRINTNARRRR